MQDNQQTKGSVMKKKHGYHQRTNPTPEQMCAMRAETDRLKNFLGGYKGLATAFNVAYYTAANWVTQGRVSAIVADAVEKSEELKKEGFSRSTLRPDITIWPDSKPLVDMQKIYNER